MRMQESYENSESAVKAFILPRLTQDMTIDIHVAALDTLRTQLPKENDPDRRHRQEIKYFESFKVLVVYDHEKVDEYARWFSDYSMGKISNKDN
jgi:hypothetical protein